MAGFIKRFVKRHSHSFIFKPLAGLGRALNRFYENRNHDMQTNGELVLLTKLKAIQPKILFDGGANVGNYSLQLIKLFPAATLYAFEPVSSTFADLGEKLSGYDNIHLVKAGLYSENKRHPINLFPSDTHSSLYDIGGLDYLPTGVEDIVLYRGDDFCREHKIDSIDFLKLDLEGAEYDALMGFEEMLAGRKIRLVQFEYGYINISTKRLLIDYFNFFEQFGYRVGKIFPQQVEFRDYQFKYENFYGSNYVALHKDDTELMKLITRKR